METAEFAAKRGAKLEDFDAELLPVVTRALHDFESGTAWYAPIVDKALDLYEEISHNPPGSGFAKLLRETLAKTKDPDETAGDTAERLAKWVSTYTANAAEFSTADSDDVLKWVTRHDDAVRSMHVAADGQTVPFGQKFAVGDYKLSYPGEPVGPPEVWIQCRCLAQTIKGGLVSDTIIAAANDQADPEDGPDVLPEDPDVAVQPHASDAPIDQDTVVPFHGVAAPVDKPTGDRRMLMSEGYSVRNLPLPAFYQRAQSDSGHSGSTIVGKFTSIELVDGLVEYEGVFNNTPEAQEAIQGVAEGWLRGVSVDLDDIVVDYSEDPTAGLPDDATPEQLMEAMDTAVTKFKQWRIAAFTIVGIPAFQEAFIALGPKVKKAMPPADPASPADPKDPKAPPADGKTPPPPADPKKKKMPFPPTGTKAGETETFAPGTHDGPGWITEPIPTGRIRRYWVSGVGAGKIKWGVEGDFNRCRTELSKYIENPDWLAGACANMHKEATGAWPGHAATEGGSLDSLVAAGGKMAAAFNIVAAAPRELPPGDWFQDPKLSAPTPFTVMDDGRVFGHVAAWGVCHIGIQNVCTSAPTSSSGYAYYRTGAIDTTLGLIPVGQITMGSGHADIRKDAAAAAAHYDNVATAVADVAAGEDIHGIWVAGRMRNGITEEQRDQLRAASLSGDWRSIRGNLEMVAALAVNTPGFPIPRLSLAASAGHQDALIASGVVTADTSTGPVQVVVSPDLRQQIREVMAVERERQTKRLASEQAFAARLKQRRVDKLNAAILRFGR